MSNRIEELRAIRREMDALAEKERVLSQPIVDNLGVIHNLYDVFRMTISRVSDNPDPTDTDNRKKFVYAILYICSPATLAGKTVRHRLRENVAEVTGCTITRVSRDYKMALFFYDTYSVFREQTNAIIMDMLDALNKKEEEGV